MPLFSENHSSQTLPPAAPIPTAAPIPQAAEIPTLPFQSRERPVRQFPSEIQLKPQNDHIHSSISQLPSPPVEESAPHIDIKDLPTNPKEIPASVPPAPQTILRSPIPRLEQGENPEEDAPTAPKVPLYARIISWLIWIFVLIQIIRAFFK